MYNSEIEPIIVTVDEAYLGSIQAVATTLQQAGMTVNNILPVLGIITGEVPRSQRESLKSVAGVLAVEEDGEMRAI